MKQFEDLRIWQDARIFVSLIYILTEQVKDYGYKEQIRRAAVSIMNNIAEGHDSGTDSLHIRFLHIAKASCGEVKSMLYLAEDLKFCTAEEAEKLRMQAKGISAGIYKLIEFLKQRSL